MMIKNDNYLFYIQILFTFREMKLSPRGVRGRNVWMQVVLHDVMVTGQVKKLKLLFSALLSF